MFQRILIPTDGSNVARKAIKAGVVLAKELGAGIVGYHAVEPLERVYYVQGAGIRPADVRALDKRLRELGEQHLAEIRKAAKSAGVACETLLTSPAAPFQGIIAAARKENCDMIFMSSHGRGKLASLLLGSVTQKVLTHSKIPVLVYR
jgi:nucleotide-binding universal stress UspA family protein